MHWELASHGHFNKSQTPSLFPSLLLLHPIKGKSPHTTHEDREFYSKNEESKESPLEKTFILTHRHKPLLSDRAV